MLHTRWWFRPACVGCVVNLALGVGLGYSGLIDHIYLATMYPLANFFGLGGLNHPLTSQIPVVLFGLFFGFALKISPGYSSLLLDVLSMASFVSWAGIGVLFYRLRHRATN